MQYFNDETVSLLKTQRNSAAIMAAALYLPLTPDEVTDFSPTWRFPSQLSYPPNPVSNTSSRPGSLRSSPETSQSAILPKLPSSSPPPPNHRPPIRIDLVDDEVELEQSRPDDSHYDSSLVQEKEQKERAHLITPLKRSREVAALATHSKVPLKRVKVEEPSQEKDGGKGFKQLKNEDVQVAESNALPKSPDAAEVDEEFSNTESWECERNDEPLVELDINMPPS